ncbi:MAG: thermonuclease family protein [Chloroflexi bacterium]|nr:thermonuclease family protein [Chloroflexota bacterium]
MIKRLLKQFKASNAPQDDGTEVWLDPLPPIEPSRRRALRLPIWVLVAGLTLWAGAIVAGAVWVGSRVYSRVTAPAARPVATALVAVRESAMHTSAPSATPARTIAGITQPQPSATTEPPTAEPPTPEPPAAEPEPPTTESPAEEPAPAVELPAGSYPARLTGIDSAVRIELEVEGAARTLQLAGIVVPARDDPDERRAALAAQAEALTTLLGQGSPLLVDPTGELGTEGELVGRLSAGGIDVGLELVRQGLAEVTGADVEEDYAAQLAVAQDDARAACVGLWTCP